MQTNRLICAAAAYLTFTFSSASGQEEFIKSHAFFTTGLPRVGWGYNSEAGAATKPVLRDITLKQSAGTGITIREFTTVTFSSSDELVRTATGLSAKGRYGLARAQASRKHGTQSTQSSVDVQLVHHAYIDRGEWLGRVGKRKVLAARALSYKRWGHETLT